jgi:hypothetical protein
MPAEPEFLPSEAKTSVTVDLTGPIHGGERA